MASLKSISENIAFSIGEQFNDTLKESIKDSIINYRALLIRQDLEKNPISYTDYLQSFSISLEEVDKSECPEIKTNWSILKSINKVPKPIRLKNNGRINFKFVGSVTRSKVLTFASAYELNFLGYLPLQENVIYYTYINGYIYVLNNIKLKKLLIEQVVADPRKIIDCDNPTEFADEIDFPIPIDMIATIKKLIKKEYSSKVNNGEEIEIEKT